jgi:thiazole synthase
MCYCGDDPIMALRLRDAGATSVMPAGSPIGSGRGVGNPAAIRMILELLKGRDEETKRARDEVGHAASHSVSSSLGLSVSSTSYPVIVDAGVGTPSDVTIAMELGADGVLLNTGIAHAKDPMRMAVAMKAACEAGYHGARAGRIPKKMYATASSTWEGVVSYIPGE